MVFSSVTGKFRISIIETLTNTIFDEYPKSVFAMRSMRARLRGARHGDIQRSSAVTIWLHVMNVIETLFVDKTCTQHHAELDGSCSQR